MKRVVDPVRLLDVRSDAPDELRRLLSEGRQALSPSDADLQRLSEHLAPQFLVAPVPPSVAHPGVGSPVGPVIAQAASKALLLKVMAIVVVGAGIGGGLKLVTRSHESGTRATSPVAQERPVEAPAEPALLGTAAVPLASTSGLASAVAPAPLEAPPSGARADRRAAPHFAPTAGADVPAPASTYEQAREPSVAPPPQPRDEAREESEVALLARARALTESDPAGAMVVLDQHQRRFPNGALEQERGVLIIEVLVRSGRKAEARARAAAFVAKFPESAHRRRIDVLLGDGSPSQ